MDQQPVTIDDLHGHIAELSVQRDYLQSQLTKVKSSFAYRLYRLDMRLRRELRSVWEWKWMLVAWGLVCYQVFTIQRDISTLHQEVQQTIQNTARGARARR